MKGAAAAFLASLVLLFASPANAGGFAGFDSVHAERIDSNDRSGDFTIPGTFTASRQGMRVQGDRASGNALSEAVRIDGNVVVHMSEPSEAVLTCDRLEIDGTQRVYHAFGHVRYVRGIRTASADQAQWSESEGMLRLQGHVAVTAVRLAEPSSILTCDRLEIDVPGKVDRAVGDVRYVEPGRSIGADRADVRERSNHLRMEGHVHVIESKPAGARV